jgi:hypothetical protein
MGNGRNRVMAAIAALFSIGYAVYLFFLDSYVLTIMPSIICMTMMGWDFFAKEWPGRKWVNVFLLVLTTAVSISALWPIAAISPFASFYRRDQWPAHRFLAELPKTPAVVLFRFDPGVNSYDDDPVYNDQTAWPDDSLVVRARDLGSERNGAIVRYYAQRQPEREFYIYDPDLRARGEYPIIGPLGTAKELAVRGVVP